MSSRFSDLTRAAASLACVALTSAACREQPIRITPAKVTRNVGGGGIDCFGGDGGIQTMDSYIIEMFEVLPGQFTISSQQSVADCRDCIAGAPDTCRLAHSACACGGPVPATPTMLREQVMGSRVGGLDVNDIYCLRLLAINTGVVGDAEEPVKACECHPDWTDGGLFDGGTALPELCAISPPRVVGSLDVTLNVRCPSDDFGGGGGPGGGGNSNLSFHDCVSPTSRR